MRLGDQFPPEEKLAYIRRSLTPGRILYLHCGFTTPPKMKYAIVGCINPKPVLFLVNSEINRWIQQRPHVRDLQVTLHCGDHPYLEYDSYIDCARAIQELPVQDLEQQLMEDLEQLKDQVTEAEQEAIVYAVSQARMLENRLKRWILEAFGGQ